MTQTINDNLQVNGSLNLRDDFNAGNTLHAVGRPIGSQDYTIGLAGSTPTSQPPNVTYLKVNDQSMGMDNLPGINTVILNPNGTFKAKTSHNISQNPSQWNSWADWVNTTAKGDDIVAVASYGVPVVVPPPQNGSAATLLLSIKAQLAFGIPYSSPYVLLFIKGQTRSMQMIGPPLPTPPYPPQSCLFAALGINYHRLLKPSGGCVGIGTTEPQGNFEVVGDEFSTPLRVINNKKRGGVALYVKDGETELVGKATVLMVRAEAEGGETIAEFFRYSGDASILLQSGSGNEVYLRFKNSDTGNNAWMAGMDDDDQFKIAYGNDGEIRGAETKLYITQSGNVGIGTTAPTHKFHVIAPDAVGLFESSGGQAYLRLSTNEGLNNRVEITNRPGGRFSIWTAGGGDQFNVTRDGNVGIGTVAPQAKLHVNGDIIATGDIVLQNADCAEEFAVANLERIEPGTVMVLGEEGSLCQSTKAYDKRVAGVVSGAGDLKPGLILDKQPESTNRMPIALMGKVYCKVDAQYAPIEVGDLLTTSPTPGHAMKATDPTIAFGTVIGKALKPLKHGIGLIPILISLQ